MTADGRGEVGAPPKRVQRQRTKGWRMPEGAVFVGRGTRWGNPFKIERVPNWPRWAGVNPRRVVDSNGREWHWPLGDEPEERPVIFNASPDYVNGDAYHERRATDLAVHLFRLHIGPMGNYEYDDDALEALAGRDLACWCRLDQPCHADVLIELANSTPTTTDETRTP